MAYQAKRSKKVIEDFELVNENGQVEHTLHVSLDAGSIVEKIRRKYVDLLRAQKKCADINMKDDAEKVQEAYTELGMAVVSIIEAVFGSEDGAIILAFYEDNYVEMSKEVIPFISGIVLPKVNDIVAENKRQILSGYNRKQRRSIMKVKH